MSQQTFDRRQLLGASVIVGAAGTALGLRAVLGQEGESHEGTPAAATPGATPGATPSAGATHIVEMTGELRFVPEHLTLKAGDSVVWRNVSTAPHTSTCDEELVKQPEHVERPADAEPWHSGPIGEGEEYSRVFPVAGEYTYFCKPHEAAGMVGLPTVEE